MASALQRMTRSTSTQAPPCIPCVWLVAQRELDDLHQEQQHRHHEIAS